MIIEGYCSLYNEVYTSDYSIVAKGAYDKSLQERPVVPILKDHEDKEVIGHSLDFISDDRGLYIKAKIYDSDDVFSILQGGRLGMSVAYSYAIIETQMPSEFKIAKKVTLLEVSVVATPSANTWIDKFTITDDKGVTTESVWNKNELKWESRQLSGG